MPTTTDLRYERNAITDLVPVQCFLHRIFPAGSYEQSANQIVADRQFKPRKDSAAFSIEFPADWEALERSADRNWRMQFQGWAFFHPIMNFFDDYQDKQRVLQFFLETARDWWSQYGNDPDDVTTSRMPKSYAWYDMSVGFRALVCAFFLNRIHHFDLPLSDADRKLLTDVANKHVNNLSSPVTFSLNNHGLFQIHGLMALIQNFQVSSEKYSALHAYALERMEALVVSQFDEHGIHLEHSPHYHFYAADVFEAIESTGWYENCKIIISRIMKANEAKKWIVDPLRRPVCVGDSILTEQSAIQFPKQPTTGPDKKPLSFITSDFNSSGYAVVRSNWNVTASNASMLFVMGMYHSSAHKHRDCLSFEWFDRGAKIICDSGKYGYKSDKYRNYFLSARAHNSVEIDGFDIIKLKPYGSAIENIVSVGAGIFKVSGKLNFPAIKHFRDLYIKPGSWMIASDDMSFAKARAFTQWFHLNSTYGLVRQSENSLLLKTAKGEQLYLDCLNESGRVVMHCGDEDAMQGFLCEKDYQFESSIALGFKFFDKSKKITTTLALGERERAEALKFVSSGFDTKVIEPESTIREKTANLLPNIKHVVIDANDALHIGLGEGTYETSIDNVSFNFYASIKPTNKLLVLLPGATNREKGHLDFQRYSWSKDFEYSVIALSDPTMAADNDISIAWFQNTAHAYGIDALRGLIKKLSTDNNILEENIVFFGSSGGGFTGLKLANHFPTTPVIAINPQIYLYNYSKPHFEKMIEHCYPGMSSQEVMRKYKDRLVVKLDSELRKAPAYIFQNIHDEKHLNLHTRHMVRHMSQCDYTESEISAPLHSGRLLHVVYFADEKSGHTPPGKEDTLSMITSVLKTVNF
ncbi:heparinase II/III family protein [Pseudomonas putida]|uniref:heparinase II/III domain-containing protein n=1 Tax=Pseudomonas putida TaxID=303 RepID=UPI001A8F4EB5|nr:heparinase II/III family protein [Pseudomonas putida]MBO0368805.1 heparinase II/III family protein [Pseudomonas putida]